MRTIHLMKPEAYDPPKTPDSQTWFGPAEGPAFEAWCAQQVAPVAVGGSMTAAEVFACGSGDLSADAAFESFPPDDVLSNLGPVTICPECFPVEAARRG